MSIFKTARLRAIALTIFLPAICLLIGSTLVLAVKKTETATISDESSAHILPKNLVNNWYFEGDNLSQVLDSTKWSATPPSALECEPLAIQLPCIYNTGTDVATRTQLMQHFQSTHSNNTAQIRDASAEKKQIP